MDENTIIYVDKLKNGKLNFGTFKRNEYVPHIYMQTVTPADTNEEIVYDIMLGKVPKSKAIEEEKIRETLGRTFQTGDSITIQELNDLGITTIHNFSEEQIDRILQAREPKSLTQLKEEKERLIKEKETLRQTKQELNIDNERNFN